MRIADGNTRRKIIDSGELVSYCERYGMEVQDEIKVNQLMETSPTIEFTSSTNLFNPIKFNSTNNYAPIENGKTYLLVWDYELDGTISGNGRFTPRYRADGVVNAFTDDDIYLEKAIVFTMNNSATNYELDFQTRNTGCNGTINGFLFRNLTSLGLADKSLEWLQTNRPDLFQNTDYIPETKTIKSVIRRIK